MKLLKKLYYKKKVLVIGIFIFISYIALYLWSIDHVLFGEFDEIASVTWLKNWKSMIFKSRSPFNFEPLGYIELLKSIRILIAPFNILIAIILGFLVFLNISCVIYMYTLPRQCRLDTKFSGIIGILPSFLTGFACCVPSFIIPLASVIGSSASFFTKFFRWILPVSFALLVYGAINGLRKVRKT